MASDNTPMMRQYKEIKAQHQDSVLLFRMGDFYEMFYSDAEEVSRLLNLTLTKRQNVPMAGLPYHALQNYLPRLLQCGKRIAICEQTELPPKNGKGISKREVVEIVSPATVQHDHLLDSACNNYLQVFSTLGSHLGMALLDFSTGEFFAASFVAPTTELRGEILQRELLLASSRELLLLEELHDEFSSEFWHQGRGQDVRLCNRIPSWCFAPDSAERKLVEFFGVKSLKGFGFENHADSGTGAALGSAWVALEYLQQNQRQVLRHIQRLLPLRRKEQLQLDSAALRNLEIFQNMQDGGRDYTLYQVLQKCRSAMGSRCLHRWLREPLLQRQQLEKRYRQVAALLADKYLRGVLRDYLSQISDLERIMSRLATGKANARDLVALRQSLALYERIYAKVRQSKNAPDLQDLFLPSKEQNHLKDLAQLLRDSVTENPPVVLHEGGMIAAGYSTELDALQALMKDRRQILDTYVAKEQSLVGAVKLKLKYNKIIGYYFEMSKAQAAQAVLPQYFIRRQSLVNGERYSTEELAELEIKLNSADEQVVQLERRLFEELCQRLLPDTQRLLNLSQGLAALDVLGNFAELAERYHYVRPQLLDPGCPLFIEGGRHPVVEQYLRDEDFISNNLELDAARFFALITGPNMAGKSTYLRQNALIVLLAQIGCYVPAKRAQIPIIDRIFCRVGASDNLSRGESTFMVEMQETARILNEASPYSLVIMDEVGRGTSTRDGLAIAQSICEYILHKIKCKTLFATHYHELTKLCEQHLKLLYLTVDDDSGKLRFLKHVAEGAIASSYGIHVAALAGIPLLVTKRAEEILQCSQLKNKEHEKADNSYLSQSQAKELYQLQQPKQALAKMELKNSIETTDESPKNAEFEPNNLTTKPSSAAPDSPKSKRSRQAHKLNLLFSEPDLLLDELTELAKNDLSLTQLPAEDALKILRQWTAKYLAVPKC